MLGAPPDLDKRSGAAPQFSAARSLGDDAWRFTPLFFRDKAARPSAWAGIWPRPSPPAREVFEEVDEILKQKLSKLMFEGPLEELTLTENAQPALMATSLAVLRVLQAEGGIALKDKAAVVAGHSLGEYSALAAAERLLRGRDRAAAAPARPGDAARRAAPARAPWRPCSAWKWSRRRRSAPTRKWAPRAAR